MKIPAEARRRGADIGAIEIGDEIHQAQKRQHHPRRTQKLHATPPNHPPVLPILVPWPWAKSAVWNSALQFSNSLSPEPGDKAEIGECLGEVRRLRGC